MTADTSDFDTSGAVEYRDSHGELMSYRWPDLPNDFVRGYIRAAFASLYDPVFLKPVLRSGPADFRGVAFSDLHPDTLASMLADCAARLASRDCVENTREGGRSFWARRQAGDRPDFPPLRLSLDPNGKVIAHGYPNVIVEPQIAMMSASISKAIRASAEGDVVEMLRAYEELKDWKE